MKCHTGRIIIFFVFILFQSTETYSLSLREAVEHTVHSNPTVAAARLNREATNRELYQAKGRLFPSVDSTGDVGRQKYNQPPAINNTILNRNNIGITVRQPIFDGWDRANDIYKNRARLDAASTRVMETSEAIALTAIEAYINVRRNRKSLQAADRNLARHREILARVQALKEGGKAGTGELNQILERVAGAELVVEQVRVSTLEAEAQFRRVVGLAPIGLRSLKSPDQIRLPRDYVEITQINNPAVNAAIADADAAMFEFRQSRSSYFPQISLEARGSTGENIDGKRGPKDDLAGVVTFNWNLFDGLIKSNRRAALADRWGQALAVRDEKQREVIEQVERAYARNNVGKAQVKILRRRVVETRKVTEIYEQEFQLGKRTLVDLVNSEAIRINTEIQLISQESVTLFAAYQVLGSMGQILERFDITPPPESELNLRSSFVPRRSEEPGWNDFKVELEPLRN